MTKTHPLRVALASVRANVVPLVVLWTAALAAIVGYLTVPSCAALFAPLQNEGGLVWEEGELEIKEGALEVDLSTVALQEWRAYER